MKQTLIFAWIGGIVGGTALYLIAIVHLFFLRPANMSFNEGCDILLYSYLHEDKNVLAVYVIAGALIAVIIRFFIGRKPGKRSLDDPDSTP